MATIDNDDLQIVRLPEISNMKGKITTEIYSVNNLHFHFSFFARFAGKNPFILSVTCSETTYGRVILKIFNEGNPSLSSTSDFMINLSINTPAPFRFKNLTCEKIKDYISNDTFTFSFTFIPAEKTASPIINSSKSEKNKRFNDRISFIARSRQFIGYVGLFNSGCTCYMNSMLQTLFNIPIFRRIVYNLETNDLQEIKFDILKNLQFLFYQLQTSKRACNTRALETSFGWTRQDLGIQHDCQEFFTVFLDAILEKVRHTESYNQLINLFQVRTMSYLENSTYQFHYELPNQDQYALRLTIIPGKSLQEMLDEPNIEPIEYNIPNVGNQMCNRIEYISQLPKVLFIHLIRTTYDIERDEMVRVAFPVKYEEQIDIKYDNGQKKANYTLHAILVHQGTTAGHYTAIIRPTTAEEWIQFNDAFVQRITQREALDQLNDCYLLVYGRTETAEEDFKKVEDDEIPEQVKHLGSSIHCNDTEISLISIADCEKLCGQFRSDYLPQDPLKIPMSKQETTKTLYQKISDFFQTEIPFTLWQCRNNGTPLNPIPMNGDPISKHVQTDIIFVEIGEYSSNVNMLTMMKYFDHDNKKLNFLGSLSILKTTKPSDLFPQIRDMSKIDKARNLIVFFESPRENQCIQIDPSLPVSQIDGFECGSTLIFQPAKAPPMSEDDEDTISYYSGQECTCMNYYSYVHKSVHANLIVDGQPFTTIYPYDLTLSELKQFFSTFLGLDDFIQNGSIVLFFEDCHDHFISSLTMEDTARQPFAPHSNDPNICPPPNRIILKTIPGISQAELREKYQSIVCYYSENSFKVDAVFYSVEPKEMTIRQILDKNELNDNKLRISLMGYGRIEKEIDTDTQLQNIENTKVVRIDNLDENAPDNMRYIIVNFEIDKRTPDDIYPDNHMSFYLPLFEDEPFSELKQRIKLITEFDDDKLFSKLRYNISKNPSSPGETLPILKNDLVLAAVDGQFTLHFSRPYQQVNHALKIYT